MVTNKLDSTDSDTYSSRITRTMAWAHITSDDEVRVASPRCQVNRARKLELLTHYIYDKWCVLRHPNKTHTSLYNAYRSSCTKSYPLEFHDGCNCLSNRRRASYFNNLMKHKSSIGLHIALLIMTSQRYYLQRKILYSVSYYI